MIVERRIATFIPYLWPPALLQSSTPRWNFNPFKKKIFPPQRRENGTFNTPDELVRDLIIE